MLSAGGPPNAPAPAERPPIDISTLDAAGRLLQLKKYVERTLIKHCIFIHTGIQFDTSATRRLGLVYRAPGSRVS